MCLSVFCSGISLSVRPVFRCLCDRQSYVQLSVCLLQLRPAVCLSARVLYRDIADDQLQQLERAIEKEKAKIQRLKAKQAVEESCSTTHSTTQSSSELSVEPQSLEADPVETDRTAVHSGHGLTVRSHTTTKLVIFYSRPDVTGRSEFLQRC